MTRNQEVASPAETVIDAFSGVKATARALTEARQAADPKAKKVPPSTVSRWRSRNGYVPGSWHLLILRAAQERGITLTTDDLIHGRRAR